MDKDLIAEGMGLKAEEAAPAKAAAHRELGAMLRLQMAEMEETLMEVQGEQQMAEEVERAASHSVPLTQEAAEEELLEPASREGVEELEGSFRLRNRPVAVAAAVELAIRLGAEAAEALA